MCAEATTAHPRSRGENPLGTLRAFRMRGSSPLTRGKPRLGEPALPHPRLIPAHAGKTQFTSAISATRRAHPRSRGENLQGTPKKPVNGGSSPLTRGKPVIGAGLKYSPRLIPAHAGKTVSRCVWSLIFGAHPRSRGENATGVRLISATHGSSPLTRGKRPRRRRTHRDRRLIPAHAGKTWLGQTYVQTPAAHPRSRGEN